MSKTASASFAKNALNLEAFSNLILALEKKDAKLFGLTLNVNRPSYMVERDANKVPQLDEKLLNSKFFRENFDALAAATDKIFPNSYDRFLSYVSYQLHDNSQLKARITALRMDKMRDPGKDPVSVFTTYLKTTLPTSSSFYDATHNNRERVPLEIARSRIAKLKRGPEFLQATQYFADTVERLADKKPAKAAHFLMDYFKANDYDLDGRNHHDLMPSHAWDFALELSLPHIMPIIRHLAKNDKELAQKFVKFCMKELPWTDDGTTLRSDIVAYLFKKQAAGKGIFDTDQLVKISAHHYRQLSNPDAQTPEQTRIVDSIREMIKPLGDTKKLGVYAAVRKEVGEFRDPFAQEYEESLTNLSASDVIEYLYKANLYSTDEMLSALDRCAQENPEKLQKLLVEFIKYKETNVDNSFNRSRLIEWVGTYVLDPSVEMDDKTRSILSYASHSLHQDDSDQKVALINMYIACEARLYDASRSDAPQTAEDMVARLSQLGKGKGKSPAPALETNPA